MALTFKTLGQALFTATTVTTCYTVPASTEATIGKISVVNVSSTDSATITVWQTPTSGTSEGDAYLIRPATTLLPGETMVMTGPKTIEAGVTIKMQASVADTLNYLIEGTEIS